MTRTTVLLNICIYLYLFSYDQAIHGENLPVEKFHSITLEMSLKPFKKNDKSYIEQVCKDIFTQWASLLNHTDTISVLLWVADGSEILDYSGSTDQPLEWSKYIGVPNTKYPVNSGPAELTLMERAYTYIKDLPVFTLDDLSYIIQTLKRVGKEMTGKHIRVGETFDPGPEFAKSTFKYERHPEICMGNTIGTKSFVCCYALLNEDNNRYAAYPDGIPQGTPFGTFLGKQCQAFLTDMNFDYLWLSNGFGFGMETWNTTGAVFDGKNFNQEKMPDIQNKILEFWQLFRKDCPDFRIETRGTNFSAGIDMASDGVDLRSIYQGGFNLLPPPNSPWAAINGDFGLELAGYMSRMAELPDERYIFRYYPHDPWIVSSPWLDRYNREPHDIYMPLSVARINGNGEVKHPTHLNLLSIDNSGGNMPEQIPNEIIPHLLYGRYLSPDRPGPVVWIYPFEEYHSNAYGKGRLEEIYFGDWFIRQAINDGFPVNTVVSTGNFVKLMEEQHDVFNESLLVTVVPEAGSEMENQLLGFVEAGGKVIVYGPVHHAGKRFLNFVNVLINNPIEGEFELKEFQFIDSVQCKSILKLKHSALMSGGGIETTIHNGEDKETSVLASAFRDGERRDIALNRRKKEWNGGSIYYVRGTNSASYKGGQLLSNDDPHTWFTGASLMRFCLNDLGYSILYEKKTSSVKNPVNCISRKNNAFRFSGFVPNTTVGHKMRFPLGAPVFTGSDTELENGFATYRFPKSWNAECRVFVEQESGIVSCREMDPMEYGVSRKIRVEGLENATVHIFPYMENDMVCDNFRVLLNPKGWPYRNNEPLALNRGRMMEGTCFEFKNVTGHLIFSW